MPSYSVSRRIWRVVYPVLIFLGISTLVLSTAIVMFVDVDEIIDNAMSYDFYILVDALIEESMAFSLEHVLLLTLISNILCCLIFIPMWRKTVRETPKFSGTNVTSTNVSLTIIISISAYFVVSGIVAVFDLISFFPSYQAVSELVIGGGFLLQFLTIGIAAPIIEELLFRGIVFNRLLFWMPVWVAIIIQAAVFGVIHGNMLQGLYAFVLGVFYGWLYVRFRTIWLPIIGHVAFNMTNVFLVAVFDFIGELDELAGAVESAPSDALVILLPAAAIFGVCLWYMLKLPKAEVIRAEDITPYAEPT
jgi:hypothetical protein